MTMAQYVRPLDGRCDPGRTIGLIMSAMSSSACHVVCCSAFMAASCSNKASGSRLFTRAPANPASVARAWHFDIPLPRPDCTRQLGDMVIHSLRVNLAGNEIRGGQDVAQNPAQIA